MGSSYYRNISVDPIYIEVQNTCRQSVMVYPKDISSFEGKTGVGGDIIIVLAFIRIPTVQN